MSTRTRFRQAASLVAIVATLGACAMPGGHHYAKASDYRAKDVKIGYATRALAAFNSNDIAGAISLAEQAVQQNPSDAGFRALLGNAYFAAGRFASAEQAFKDSLSLYDAQPKIMLKLALVEIAQGKRSEALSFLGAARPSLDAADYGLAVALAGQPDQAIEVLRDVAGQPNADPRARQNLALAYALAQDWTNARVVASQDVPADQLDQRIDQWMQMASAGKPDVQVATLIGVTPAATDPGEPVALALVKVESATQQAAADPLPMPVPEPAQGEPVVAFAPPPPPAMVAASAPVDTAQAQQEPQAGSLTVALPEARPVAPAIAAASPNDFPYVEVRKRSWKANRASTMNQVAATKSRKPLAPLGKNSAVVQLGAYSNSESVARAWNAAARRYAGLKNYAPVSARFSGPTGTFYRLSVHGFDNSSEASKLCGSIKRGGGNCFVRTAAGDRPMQIASL